MTKRLVEYELEDGSSIMVEVEENTSGRVIPTDRDGGTVIRAQQTFEAAIAKIKPAARAVLVQLEEMQADTVEVTFGLKLSAEAGALIASGSVDANYTVKLTWTHRTKEQHQ